MRKQSSQQQDRTDTVGIAIWVIVVYVIIPVVSAKFFGVF